MIHQETIYEGELELVHTWSDTYKIRQIETGIIYYDAVDIPGLYTYEETDIPLN